MMKVKQLNQLIAWLVILAKASSTNAGSDTKEPSEIDQICPGGYYLIDAHTYTIDLFLRDGFSAIDGNTDIQFTFHRTNEMRRHFEDTSILKQRANKGIGKGHRPYYMSRMCCETKRDCHFNMRLDGRLNIENASKDIRLEKRGSIRSTIVSGREEITNIKRNGGDLVISVHFRSHLGSSYKGKLSIAYTRSPGSLQEAKDSRAGEDDSLSVSRRLRSNQIHQLFPSFIQDEDPRIYKDERDAINLSYLRHALSRSKKDPDFKVTIRQPDVANAIVSNVPWDGRSVKLTSGKWYDSEHTQSSSLSELSFAVGPFYKPSQVNENEDSRDYPTTITYLRCSLGGQAGFAKEFRDRTLGWVRKYSPANVGKIDESYLKEYKFVEIGQITSSLEPNVETALTMALWTAQKWLKPKREKGCFDHWPIEGLAVYFAIRMVRELQPHLRVDEYVRETLLPWAMDYEARNNFAKQKLAYYNLEGDDDREPVSIFLWSIKSAAIIDMIRRSAYRDQQTFDNSVSTLLKQPDLVGSGKLGNALAGELLTGTQLRSFKYFWEHSYGYPCIGVSLDKQRKSLILDQIPINWLANTDRRVKDDVVWPMPIVVKFFNGIEAEIVTVPIEDGFDGKRTSLRVPLPDWFKQDNPGHKFSLDIQDQEGLSYYRVSYSPDLIKMIKHN